MSMSKKHYIAIAQVLQDTRPEKGNPDYELWLTIRDGLAIELNRMNREFSVDRFEDWTER